MAKSIDKKQPRSNKQSTTKKKAVAKKKQTVKERTTNRVKNFLARRPHRSFRRTRRRDYKRSLKLPGYWAFTGSVLKVLRENKKHFLVIGLLYGVISLVFLGIGSQESFTSLRETLAETGGDLFEGNWGEVGKATLLAFSTVAGNISPELTEVQQVYAILAGLLFWLSLIYLLRQRFAGNKVKVRDALYSSGSPIIPIAIIFLVLLVQLIPVALAAIGYSAAQATGLLSGGIEAMLFWIAAGGLTTLSLYWLTGTATALVIVTLPGMYPFRALAIAGDMVVGRRLRILYRLLWMGLLTVLFWITVLIPFILLDTGIKSLWPAIEWLPIVPVVMLLLSVVTLIWTATYIYTLYRRIVDDDAKPA